MTDPERPRSSAGSVDVALRAGVTPMPTQPAKKKAEKPAAKRTEKPGGRRRATPVTGRGALEGRVNGPYGEYFPEYGEGPRGQDYAGRDRHIATESLGKMPEKAADPTDAKAVGYAATDAPAVPKKYAALPVVRGEGGHSGHWNDDFMHPAPSTVYVADERYLYVTDSHGRVTHAEGWMGWLDPNKNDERRNTTAQRDAGGPDRQWFDQGGHIFGAAFAGPGESINLAAQSASQNMSQVPSDVLNNWGRLEEMMKRIRSAGEQVHMAVDLAYPGDSPRPLRRTVALHHEGVAEPLRVFKERPMASAGKDWHDYNEHRLGAPKKHNLQVQRAVVDKEKHRAAAAASGRVPLRGPEADAARLHADAAVAPAARGARRDSRLRWSGESGPHPSWRTPEHVETEAYGTGNAGRRKGAGTRSGTRSGGGRDRD